MKQSTLIVTDPVGLHARPASLFVRLANTFNADIRLRNLSGSGTWVNAKSILNLLTIGVNQNHQIEIQAIGQDEDSAIAALESLIRSDFSEKLT